MLLTEIACHEELVITLSTSIKWTFKQGTCRFILKLKT